MNKLFITLALLCLGSSAFAEDLGFRYKNGKCLNCPYFDRNSGPCIHFFIVSNIMGLDINTLPHELIYNNKITIPNINNKSSKIEIHTPNAK